MRLLLIFILISFSGSSQRNTSVRIVPTTNVSLDSSTSYIYCATMDLMWNKLSQYLGEKPKPSVENATIEILNQSVFENYQAPIEDSFVVAHTGLVKDSIVQRINSELKRKFGTTWNPSFPLRKDALVSYSHLKKDVEFYYNLDDHFYNQAFDGGIHVDYFGLKEGDPKRSRKDILIHDFKSTNDFIVQIKCRDSMDEIYLAKIPLESTLLSAYQKVLERVNFGVNERFSGSDILSIPYMKFDTTANYTEIEGASLTNESIDGMAFQQVSQRIGFDLNPQGIKLESSVVSIIEFADFDNPPPRVLAFNKPFLIVMKRKNAEQPYYLHWVSGIEFMRSYILKTRVIEEHESIIVGKWKCTKKIVQSGKVEEYANGFPNGSYVMFHANGTYEKVRSGYRNNKGIWRYDQNVIWMNPLSTLFGSDYEYDWKLDEVSGDKFVIGGKTKLVFEKD